MLNVKEGKKGKQKKCRLANPCLGGIKVAYHPLLSHQVRRVTCQMVRLLQLVSTEVLLVAQCTELQGKEASKTSSAS